MAIQLGDLSQPYSVNSANPLSTNLLALFIYDGTNVVDVISGEVANATTTPTVYGMDSVGQPFRNATFNFTDMGISDWSVGELSFAIYGMFKQSSSGTSGDTIQFYTGLNLTGSYIDIKSDDNWGDPSRNKATGAYNATQADSTLIQTPGVVQVWGVNLNKSGAYHYPQFWGQGTLNVAGGSGHMNVNSALQSIGLMRGDADERAYVIAIWGSALSSQQFQDFQNDPYNLFANGATQSNNTLVIDPTASTSIEINNCFFDGFDAPVIDINPSGSITVDINMRNNRVLYTAGDTEAVTIRNVSDDSTTNVLLNNLCVINSNAANTDTNGLVSISGTNTKVNTVNAIVYSASATQPCISGTMLMQSVFTNDSTGTTQDASLGTYFDGDWLINNDGIAALKFKGFNFTDICPTLYASTSSINMLQFGNLSILDIAYSPDGLTLVPVEIQYDSTTVWQ